MKLCVLDLETTGLEPVLHQVWEVGLIVRDGTAQDEYLWRLKPELARADPEALRKNRFYARTAGMPESVADSAVNLATPGTELAWSPVRAVGAVLAPLLDDAIVVGANPGFDRDFVRPFLRQSWQAYTAHYRPVCVTTLVAGFLYGYGRAPAALAWPSPPAAGSWPGTTRTRTGNDLPAALAWPWSSNAISAAVGVDPADYDRHTALDDCRWALAQLDAVTGGPHG